MNNKRIIAFVIGTAIVVLAGLVLSLPVGPTFPFLTGAAPVYSQTTMYAAPGIPARRPIAFWSSGAIPSRERAEEGMMYGGGDCTRVDNKYRINQSVATLSSAVIAYASHPNPYWVTKNSEYTETHGFILLEHGREDYFSINWLANTPGSTYISVVEMRPTTMFDRLQAFIRGSYRKPKP